jgi:hypothetical protein
MSDLPILRILKAVGEAVIWMAVGAWVVIALVFFNAFTFSIATILLALASFTRTRSKTHES